MVYFEAIANSLDAGADNINVLIELDKFSSPESLIITIEDNGEGFLDKNFDKFCKLLETEEADHKGLGRLVFLNYFRNVDIESHFLNNRREFRFNNQFNGNSTVDEKTGTGTKLRFHGHFRKAIKTYDFIRPKTLKDSIELHFFPQLHERKVSKRNFRIEITLRAKEQSPKNNLFNETVVLDNNNLRVLEEKQFKADQADLFSSFNLYYSIEKESKNTSVVTAICAEGRTINFPDLITKDSVPPGHEIIFLLYSDYFNGKVNSSRQGLDIEEGELQIIKNVLVDELGSILQERVPAIKERNEKTIRSLNDRYPHLTGYLEEKSVGLIDRSKSLDQAQRKFFKDQRDILDANSLTEEKYQKSLDISARLLTEYVLYRNLTIRKLKEVSKHNDESEIHEIIVPMRKTLKKEGFFNDIYSNNVWVLDDKFMSYKTILSDQKMEKVLKEIQIESDENDTTRPDISLIFSGNPDDHKVDMVVVELKKLGLGLAKKEEVESQLRQRARKLLQYYDKKIQRIWFYGVVDIDSELRISLKESGYTELFSNDSVLYAERKIIVDETTNYEVPSGFYIMSFKALVEDAETRNSTFLEILKEGIRKSQSSN